VGEKGVEALRWQRGRGKGKRREGIRNASGGVVGNEESLVENYCVKLLGKKSRKFLLKSGEGEKFDVREQMDLTSPPKKEKEGKEK